MARIVSQESSKHMEKVLKESPLPPTEGGMSFVFGIGYLSYEILWFYVYFSLLIAYPQNLSMLASVCYRDPLIHFLIRCFSPPGTVYILIVK